MQRISKHGPAVVNQSISNKLPHCVATRLKTYLVQAWTGIPKTLILTAVSSSGLSKLTKARWLGMVLQVRGPPHDRIAQSWNILSCFGINFHHRSTGRSCTIRNPRLSFHIAFKLWANSKTDFLPVAGRVYNARPLSKLLLLAPVQRIRRGPRRLTRARAPRAIQARVGSRELGFTRITTGEIRRPNPIRR
ncbi:hypothetical protein AMTR_s00053p00061240 [Amborella trichopoda]|uniref:Uncharacterized protein n=1 Tax=Amborella trichopoda TaxID=13333 RepID=W1PD98_AMBTC|nr:hypothetical protein AMTR_s00053p00061240 [Amborella trichopoda]